MTEFLMSLSVRVQGEFVCRYIGWHTMHLLSSPNTAMELSIHRICAERPHKLGHTTYAKDRIALCRESIGYESDTRFAERLGAYVG
jgi:hypothetical protein